MTCDRFAEALADLADGSIHPEAPEKLEMEVERHLETCPRCRTLLHDLRQIRQVASQLDRLSPSPQVWTRIAGQLAPPGRGKTGALPHRRARTAWWGKLFGLPDHDWRTPAALLAALVLVVASAVWFALRPVPSQTPGQSVSSGRSETGATSHGEPGATPSAATGGGELVQSVEMELQLAERHYEKAIAGLEQIAQIAGTGGSALDAQTAATLQRNLAVIDQAIGESRAALRSQPSSEPAQESLFEAFRTKVALLQEAVLLINEMRKGNQAETARIVGDLNR